MPKFQVIKFRSVLIPYDPTLCKQGPEHFPFSRPSEKELTILNYIL